jgi:hypothetical protein
MEMIKASRRCYTEGYMEVHRLVLVSSVDSDIFTKGIQISKTVG